MKYEFLGPAVHMGKGYYAGDIIDLDEKVGKTLPYLLKPIEEKKRKKKADDTTVIDSNEHVD